MKQIYKNDPIHEALLEFRFNGYSEVLDDPVLPGRFYELIKEDYSGQKQNQMGLKATLTTDDQGPQSFQAQNQLNRVNFFNDDMTRSVAIGSGHVSISIFNPYCGWENFKESAQKALESFLTITEGSVVERVGLRYVNKFTVPIDNPRPETYLKEVDGFFGLDDSEIENFYSRTERRFPDGTRLIAQQLNSFTDDQPELVLDLDLIQETRRTTEINDMLNIAEELHNKEKSCFELLITDSAREIFNA